MTGKLGQAASIDMKPESAPDWISNNKPIILVLRLLLLPRGLFYAVTIKLIPIPIPLQCTKYDSV